MILITGGTGFVGGNLLFSLAESGEAGIRLLVRSQEKEQEARQKFGVDTARGDVLDPESLERAVEGVDRIIHLAALIRDEQSQSLEDVNYQGTLNLLEAARRRKVKHFLHMSSVSVSSQEKNPYLRSKGRAEQAVQNSGLIYTILKPSLLIGDGSFFIRQLEQPAGIFPWIVPYPKPLKGRYQPLWVGDLTRCMKEIINDYPGFVGEVIKLGGPEYLSFKEILEEFLRQSGRKKAMVGMPRFFFRLAGTLSGAIFPQPLVTETELELMDRDFITDLRAVENRFGFTPLSFSDWLKTHYRQKK